MNNRQSDHDQSDSKKPGDAAAQTVASVDEVLETLEEREAQEASEATATPGKAMADLLQTLQAQVEQLKEKEKRSLADYQNLVRRTQEDRAKVIRMANVELASALLQPLDHLNRAAEQLNDRGLSMVVQEFWRVLSDQGLAEISVMGKTFDVETMEVVEKQGKGEIVIEVVRPGYTLNGEVIQHAKVILG